MKTDVYRNFITVADCGRIGEAADIICITQPALSKQIKSLETMYKAQLFQRGPKGLALTAAGKTLYDRAKALCRIEDEAIFEIGSTSEESSTVNIGISPEVVSDYWMQKLAKLHDANSNVRFNVQEAESDFVLDLLQQSVLDVGIISEHPPSSFRIANVTSRKPVLVSSLSGPWPEHNASALSIADLRDVPLCLTRSCLDRLVDACRNEGFFPNVMFTSTSRHTVMEWALEGRALALTHKPDKADFRLDNARCMPLDCPDLESQTLVVARKDQTLSPFVQQFVTRLCEIS